MAETTVAARIATHEAEAAAPVPACSLTTYLLLVLGFALAFVVLGTLA